MYEAVDPDGPAYPEDNRQKPNDHAKENAQDHGQRHILYNKAGDDPERNKKRCVDPITHEHGAKIKPRLRFE